MGKIFKREKKSGAGQVKRSVREQDMMETWSFFNQHIVRNKTFASEKVSTSFSIPLCLNTKIARF